MSSSEQVYRQPPIGVFDSGLGGLSLLRDLRLNLPNECFLYVADNAWLPYGDKGEAVIRRRSHRIARYFVEQGAKAMVVACNTATAAAVAALRDEFAMPIIGVEPGIKPAVQSSHSGVIGVLVTSRTSMTTRFNHLRERFKGQAEIIVQPCPGLVEHIERGDLDSADLQRLLHTFIAPLLARGADTLVLGCTHYPFLAPLLRHMLPALNIIDTGPPIARYFRRRLKEENLLSSDIVGEVHYFSSGPEEDINKVARRLCDDDEIMFRRIGLD